MTDDDREETDLARLAAPRLSPAALREEANALCAKFMGRVPPCAQRWEPAGLVRRSRPGWEVVHLVIPRQGANGECLVAKRIAELESPGYDVIESSVELPNRAGWVVMFRNRPQAVRLTTPERWGPAVAKHTGPDWLWERLVQGLMAAGRLTLQPQCGVAWLDRDGRQHPLACPSERDFFRLARHRYLEPWMRRDVPPAAKGGGGFPILGEWYPPSVPYPSARERRGLFHPGRPRPPPS